MMKAIWKRRASDERGFTLVEMLVVIAILGILAAVAVFALGGTSSTSKEAACKTDRQTVQAAADAYAADNNGSYTGVTLSGLEPDYLRSVPGGNGYTFTISTSNGAVTAVAETGGSVPSGCN